ncbi:tRNA methyltransferase complex GCD14 subunit-domain-containing protein, partial [Aspergillus oleicola]
RKANQLDSPSAASTPGDEDADADSSSRPTPEAPIAAASGFLHILCPTPELWTASLPHRTQVVYTPDYSYVLHRLGVHPGSTLIEAGAGSGSFTHAAARAVFNGYPSSSPEEPAPKRRRRLGKVCSFEFHAQRAEKIRDEVSEHGLDGLVHVTHRDVYSDGFLLNDSTDTPKTSPKANAIFLDLPAPWLALKHLVRNPANGAESPLDSNTSVHLCTFSPCMEQVQRTISAMRQNGWLHISMVELQHKRIDVKREKTGLEFEGARGANVFPKNVDDAVAKMRIVEERSVRFREQLGQNQNQNQNDNNETTTEPPPKIQTDMPNFTPTIDLSNQPSYAQGKLVHRSESDLKTHTSYLVFAILPREWSEEDEKRCVEKWPSQNVDESAQEPSKGKSRRQMKKEVRTQREREEKGGGDGKGEQ